MKQNRRTFLITSVGAAAGLAAANLARAQTAPLAETDPQAQALGYKSDATKADKVKYPKYAAGQMCGTCQLFQGKPSDATGPCALFPGKAVAAKGWCSAWVKKA
jgi:hypothetical protein